ncbi:MAG: hypothetical protein M1820_002479 [Bogoriella megaspora]|nr:MAG: hypothetical protein M1820_002479 [Bogoriella megaspora]
MAIELRPPKMWAAAFSNQNNPALQPAEEAKASQRQFWQKIRISLKKRDLQRIDSAVQRYENDASIEGLEALVAEYLPQAENEKEKLHERRTTGAKHVSTECQKFAKTFSDFLGCYSQVIDIAKEADIQFGGVAVQTLSLLLIVVANKQKKEDIIEDSLHKMQLNFPRLQGFRNIYPTPQMQQLIMQVYKDVLQFSEKAIEYYRRSAWTRVWQAVSSPPQIEVKLAADKVFAELAEVREEAGFLQNKRIHRLEQNVQRLTAMVEGEQAKTTLIDAKVSDVEQGVEELRRHEGEDLLRTLKEFLIPPNFSLTEMKDDYTSQLHTRFSSKRLSPFTLPKLAEQTKYQSWRSSSSSQTLILHGSTRTAAQTPLSWLSNAAIELIGDLSSSSESVTIYYFGLREGMPAQKSMHTVLSTLIYQLLSARPQLLEDRTRYQKYHSQLTSGDWVAKKVRPACALFVDVLSHFQSVYLIFDRPEECKGCDSGVQMLLQMTRDLPCMIKTLFVVDKDRKDRESLDDWVEVAAIGTVDVLGGLDQI